MNTIITNIDELNVGDVILIKSKPKTWSSALKHNCPLQLKFPTIINIKEIEYIDYEDKSLAYVAMTCGDYGWDLEAIIKAGCERIEPNKSINQLINEFNSLL